MSKKLSRIIILVLTIIISLWVSRALLIGGIHNGISLLNQIKQFGISFSFLIKPLHLLSLLNPSEDGLLYLLRLTPTISFISSAIAIPSGLLLLISSVAILRSKQWGLKATALAANCYYFIYSINMLVLGLRFNFKAEIIILGYLPVIYLSFVPFLKPLRERVGLGASTIREKTGAIALPVLIFVFSGIIYVNTVNAIISKETLTSKLKSGSEIEELFKNAKYPACEWIDQWSFCIPKGLIKQKPISKEKDSEIENALWKNNNNQYVFLSMPAVTEKITLPPSKNKNYELEKEISNAGFWDGLAALGYKDFSIHRNSKNEIYDLVRPNIKTIVYIAHTQNKNNWYVNANIYPLNSKSINYKSSNKSLETALAPLIMTLNEYEKRINKKTN